MRTSGGQASLKSKGLTAEDVESAIKTFKILDRLAGTVRDRTLTDWLGKQLYALKKSQMKRFESLLLEDPSGVKRYPVCIVLI